jgi:hypothetical protein
MAALSLRSHATTIITRRTTARSEGAATRIVAGCGLWTDAGAEPLAACEAARSGESSTTAAAASIDGPSAAGR